MTTYIVRFIRRDHKPNEDYYYNDLSNAEAHFFLFKNDDSNLYDEIDLIDYSDGIENIIDQIQF